MPTTPNRGLEAPLRGEFPGTWDVPVNFNWTSLDTLFGAVVTKSAASTNITLSAADILNGIIRVTGALSANIDLIFPTIQAYYTVENLTTGNFFVRCRMVAGNIIAVPQGKPTAIFTDGTDTKFQFPADPATIWEFAGANPPVWIAACTVKPWLLCDGTIYNVSDYPYLFAQIGGAYGGNGISTFAVPNHINRLRIMRGVGPVTPGNSGINGNSLGAVGGSPSVVLVQPNLPSGVTLVTTIPAGQGVHQHASLGSGFIVMTGIGGFALVSGAQVGDSGNVTQAATLPAMSGTTALGGSSTPVVTMPPTIVSGLVFIKT